LTYRQALHAAKASRAKEAPQVEWMPSAMSHPLPPLVERVRAALPAGQEIYLVGGAVRDLLLDRPSYDFDFVLPGKAIAAARRVANALHANFYPLDEVRDVGRVIVEEGKERATLDFITLQGADIDTDLAARDLTINAMAIDLRSPDALLDPCDGAADLKAKRVRACTPDAFRNDPVRVLRAIRMAASFSMRIEKGTRQALRGAASGLSQVSAERLRDELFRLLNAPKLAASLRALEVLGALQPVLPELVALKGVEQSAPHAFDVWEHTLQVVNKLDHIIALLGEHYSPDGAGSLHSGLVVMHLGRYRSQFSELMASELVPGRRRRELLMLATMFHDAGKPAACSVEADGRIRFIGHAEGGAELIAARCQVLHLSNDELDYLTAVVRGHGRPFELTLTGELPSPRAIYRYFHQTGELGVDICLLSLADFMGKYGAELPQDVLIEHLETLRMLLEAFYEKRAQVVSPTPFLNGDDLLKELSLQPGPKIGELLETLREAQAIGEISTRAEALAWAKSLL
jgi:tRNA nucleotidyltransferase/poly(A) polymerase